MAMFNSIITYSQQSINDYGFIGNPNNSNFRMNSVESNINNYSSIEDWELTLALKSILNTNNNFNLNIFSLGKRIDNHYLYMRYTPGIKQEYIFNSRTEFLIGDSIQNYKTNLSYSEKYGFGYSYDFNNQFSLGISLRYFQQEFTEEYPTFFSDDTTQIIQIRNELVNKNFWRGDFGIQYMPLDNLSLSLSSTNLVILKDFDEEDNDSEFGVRTTDYNIKQNKAVIVGVNYSPSKNLTLEGKFESTNSFVFGYNYNFRLNDANLTFGTTILHDKHQLPFIAGILPSLNYSNSLFSVTLSYLKYFEDRTEAKSLVDFNRFGIQNIQNNNFSSDRLNVIFNFALSFKKSKIVEFIDVKIKSEIFPTFKDNYLDHPLAIGRVVNLTEKVVSIKPSCYIKDITAEIIYSPILSVQPFDTVDVPFFILIDNENTIFEKTKISSANFYLTTINEEPDDTFQKPVLVHEMNNWDGKVNNLRYFVKSDFDYSNNY